MPITYMLETLNLSGAVASKPFLALFLAGLLIRLTGVVEAADALTGTVSLVMLGALALAELLFADTPEIVEVQGLYGPYLRAVAGFYLTISIEDPAIIQATDNLLGGRPFFGWFWAMVVAAATLMLSFWRAQLFEQLAEFDPDNDLGLITVLKWAETSWAATFTLLAIFFVQLSITLFVLTLLGLYIAQRLIDHLQERQKVACAHCGTRHHPSALVCPACQSDNAQPVQVGIFGQATSRRVTDVASHRFSLISRKRCPVCAARLAEHGVQQQCNACGTPTFADTDALEQYLTLVRARLMPTMVVCLVCSAIPLVGLVPGIIYYRLSLIAGLRGYLPRGKGFFTRWGVRGLNLLLMSFQWVPVVGAILLPILAWTNHAIYQSALRTEASKVLAGQVAPKQALLAASAATTLAATTTSVPSA